MFNLDKVVVSLDGKQFSASRKFRINDIAAGDHQLKIYKPKKYLNPKNNSISERLIPVYSGSVFVADKSCTACTLNEYHDKVVVIN